MNQIVGHETILALLERTALRSTPAHSYLFTGSEGIGKKLVALRFIRQLNCPEGANDPQGTCSVCRRITGSNHPDVQIVRPERGSIRIEQARGIHHFFKFPPSEGRWRICLIDDAHLLNRSAQNALLKTMEEPPASRILFLVTSKPYLLLPTVRSRCRRIRFGALSNQSVAKVLEEIKQVSPDESFILASMAGGSVQEALRLDNPTFRDMRKRLIDALSRGGVIGFGEIMGLSAAIAADLDTARDAIRISMSWLRDLLSVRCLDEESRVINQDSLSVLKDLSERFSPRQLLAAYNELVATLSLIESEINVNRNLATDVMFLRLTRLLRNPDPKGDDVFGELIP
ncbi:MAG: polymerase subunit delta [Thermodesulfobacteriota bacterium]|nr:polymerase subunit delta [Thermodesulfobacteriota bacterium]